MCILAKGRFRAAQDMKVYKVVMPLPGGGYQSYYDSVTRMVLPGYKHTGTDVRYDTGKQATSSKGPGLFTYRDVRKANEEMSWKSGVVLECTIPAGAWVRTGDDGEVYASSKLIIGKQVDWTYHYD